MSNTHSAATTNGKRHRASRRRKWGVSENRTVIDWSNEILGNLRIDTRKFEIGDIKQVGPNSWAPINLKHDTPTTIRLDVAHEVHDDVFVIRAQGGEISDVSYGIPSFDINVEWTNGKPHTREKDKDNFDLVFLKENGLFIQLQISIVTRNSRFWLCVQEIWGGAIVKDDGKFAVLPLYSENAYPGADYLSTFKNMGPKVIEFAVEHCKLEPAEAANVQKWDPAWNGPLPDQMKKNGWIRATPTFFNLVIGWGFVLCEDGKSCFVHFNNIVDENGRSIASKGELPVLQPMTCVALKYKEGEKGRQATAVRVL